MLAFRLDYHTKWTLTTFLIFCLPAWPPNSTASGELAADVPPPEGRESISEIMDASGTDKLTRHSYDRYYERYFAEFRDQVDLRILEIGADSGVSLKVPIRRTLGLAHL